jgi:hypothetical protein
MADRNGYVHRRFIFPVGKDEALQHYIGCFLPLALAWRYINKNSTKNSYCLCSDLPGSGWLTGMGGRSLAVYFFHGHGLSAATLLQAASCSRHWLGASTIKTALKIPTVCVQISQGLDG